MSKHSNMVWYSLTHSIRSDFVKEITQTQVNYSSGFNWGQGIMEENEFIYHAKGLPTRIMPYSNTFVNAITYEIGSTKHVLHRFEYGLLEMLSELGGLFEIFRITGFVMIYVFLSEPLYFVASSLIKPSVKSRSSSKSSKNMKVRLPSHSDVQ